MKRHFLLPVVILAGSMELAGCFSSTRIVQQTQPPEMYRSAAAEVVQQQIQDRDAKLQTLSASVLITATTGGGRTGKETTYESFKGYIYVRKPRNLRVLLQLPVLGSRALDMVSDQNGFTMMHTTPPGHPDVWMQGSNVVTKPSANGLENLRPPVFFDSLLVPGVGADEFVEMHESIRLIQPTDKHKPMIEEPDYDLTVMKRGTGNVLVPERVIHISRINMLPYQQDIFDDKGVQIVTTATYDKYQITGGVEDFPMLINISRPLDQYQLKIEIQKLTLNQKLEDDQFKLEIPAGVTVQKMQ